jgi:hypothetical protein
MTPRTRDTLLLIAGLPGIVAIGLPVAHFFGPIVPAQVMLFYFRQLLHLHLPEPAFWLALPVLLPIAIATLQLYRLARGTPSKRVLTVALTVVALLAAVCLVLSMHFLLRDVRVLYAWLLVVLAILTTANLALLYRNLHRRRALDLTTELLMLGTYVAVMPVWLIELLQKPYIGPRLILWTCLVYLVTLAIRLRSSSPRTATSP